MGLVEKNTRNVDNKYWLPGEDLFPVKSRYTAGIAGQKFCEGLKSEGKIYGVKCKECGITYVPPKAYCEQCFEELSEWIDVGTEGTLYSYTVAYREKDDSKKSHPTVIAAIKIADGLLIHWLGESKPQDLEFGMKVAAEFKPQQERVGGLLDIAYFKPV